jgi:CHASE3 domain sensor protein
MARRSIETKIQAAIAIGLILLCVVGTVSYLSIDRLLVQSGWVDHTHRVIESLRTGDQRRVGAARLCRDRR